MIEEYNHIFWKAHCRGRPGFLKFFSDEFKDLIIKMLQFNPKDRLSLEDIKKHAWYIGKIATK